MSKIDNFPYPTPVPAKILIGMFPFSGVDPSFCGLQRAKLFLQNSNLYDHNTSMLQTYKRADGQTTCLGNTMLCVASRGKRNAAT